MSSKYDINSQQLPAASSCMLYCRLHYYVFVSPHTSKVAPSTLSSYKASSCRASSSHPHARATSLLAPLGDGDGEEEEEDNKDDDEEEDDSVVWSFLDEIISDELVCEQIYYDITLENEMDNIQHE
jgi:hypothetical protein